jgi:cyclopropane fatty-acyl-phospholipid synthase-like methyltransferase
MYITKFTYLYAIFGAAILKTNKPMINKVDGISQITDYYDIYSKIYLDIWGNYDNLSLHCGYYENDEEIQSHDESIIKMNRFIADLAQIKQSDLILDAGCSVGGSSIWFAKNYGARIIGISLSEKEVSLAKQFAKEKFVKNVDFKVMDYHNTTFPSGAFDTILAIESVCYSLEKSTFLNECFRLLKTRGKIVITDYFHTDNLMTNQQRKAIERVNEDYSVELCSMIQFKDRLEKFEYVKIFDVTSNVRKSYIEGLKKIEKTYLNSTSEELKKYIKKEFSRVSHEFDCLQQGLLKYGVIVAQKK